MTVACVRTLTHASATLRMEGGAKEDPQVPSPPSAELRTTLERIGLSQYYDSLVANGFEDWETVCCISEKDFEELGFKVGHRRVLQREIRKALGLPRNRAPVSSCGGSPHASGVEVSGRSSTVSSICEVCWATATKTCRGCLTSVHFQLGATGMSRA